MQIFLKENKMFSHQLQLHLLTLNMKQLEIKEVLSEVWNSMIVWWWNLEVKISFFALNSRKNVTRGSTLTMCNFILFC